MYVGHTGQIPKGGYYAYLGRSLLSSRKILNRLTKQFWFDLKTRYLIVEFASYSADSNFLTVVKLIIEKSASDSFRTSPHITAIPLRRPLDSSIPHYVGLILIPASYTILITLIWYFYMSDHPPSNLFRYYHQYISFYDLLMIILVFIYTMFFHTLQIAQRTAIRQVGRILIKVWL
ncbi:uncharacterized protein LOC123294199 [Chrysoperla carnea]|uniref:uncharacterized protein LOC123294199 n=1 Tax=Chrysoperla carnea TaxID=189513 RepID=UPI001D076082|nr:uncharacterized protein LOC123294199 [Chrysoperla carnea]